MQRGFISLEAWSFSAASASHRSHNYFRGKCGVQLHLRDFAVRTLRNGDVRALHPAEQAPRLYGNELAGCGEVCVMSLWAKLGTELPYMNTFDPLFFKYEIHQVIHLVNCTYMT